jgi:MFS family permease
VRARLNHTFASLRTRNYRLFFLGQLVSLVGLWMQVAAQDWLVLSLSHNSGTALGVVTALQFTPVLLLTLYGGTLADRFDKRLLLRIANGIWFFLAIGMGVLVLSGVATIGHVYVFAAALGMVNAFETPTRQAFVSDLVEPSLLPNALSLNATAFNLARITGPAVGGLAIALMGTGPVFIVNGLSYIGPLVGLALMRPAELHGRVARAGQVPVKARVREGLAYAWRRNDLMLPIALMFVIGMLGFNFQLTLPLMAKAVFGTGPAQFGLLTTALATGALCGALFGAQRRRRPSAELVLGSAAAFAVLETLVGFTPTFWTMAALLVPTGFFMILFAQAANQRVQLGTDAALRGRVMALYILVFFGTTPVGAPLVGWTAQHFGARAAIWFGGAVSLLAVLAAFAVRAWLLGLRMHVHLTPFPRVHVRPTGTPRVREAPAQVVAQ